MGAKNQYPVSLGPSALNQPGISWQSVNPITGFLPLNGNTQGQGSVPSGVLAGVMVSTNVIYSQIIDISRMDNSGLEITWTGTPTGTLQIMCSNSGINFYPLTFNPALTQPAGSGGGYLINLNQVPFKYVMLQYTNSGGTGVLTAYAQMKDLN